MMARLRKCVTLLLKNSSPHMDVAAVAVAAEVAVVTATADAALKEMLPLTVAVAPAVPAATDQTATFQHKNRSPVN